jgi:hypothetical protein
MCPSAHCVGTFFPLVIDVTREICTAFLIEMSGTAQMHIKIHEDNVGAGPQNIELVKISSQDQLGDIFTKGLSRVSFSFLQKKLMDW